jgi:ABC-type nickel/cobalt efflux system permease component RcnA
MSDHTQIWLSCLCLLVLFLPNVLKIIWLNNLLFLSVPDEVYSRNILYTLNLISKLVLLSLGRYLCWLAISSQDYHSPSSEVFQH